MNLYVMNALFFSFGAFLIATLIFLKRRDELAKRWVYFTVFVTLWGIFYAFIINNDVSNDYALYAARMSNASAAFIPVTWLYFLCAFLDKPYPKALWVGWPIAALLMASGPTSLLVPSMSPAGKFIHYTEAGPLFHVHALHFFVIVSYGFYALISSYLAEPSAERRKEILSLFFATIFGFLGGGTTYLGVYFRTGWPDLTFLLCTFPLLMGYVMIKHGVLDPEKVVNAFQRERLATLGMLAASVNHEIRNPLYIVKAYSERLLAAVKSGSLEKLSSQERDKKLEEVLERTVGQMGRAVEMTEKITGFSKPSTDTLEKIHLNEAIETVLSFIGYGLERDNIQIEKKLNLNHPIHANRKEMEQIFLNLIMNASQAMPKGGLLTIANRQHDGRIQVDISDTGEGIPSNNLKQLFEPFFTTKKDEGTGLGLYIVKKLVERNGGKIKVTSEVGRGTTFSLEFSIAP